MRAQRLALGRGQEPSQLGRAQLERWEVLRHWALQLRRGQWEQWAQAPRSGLWGPGGWELSW